jgi:hypothetical protein
MSMLKAINEKQYSTEVFLPVDGLLQGLFWLYSLELEFL